MNEEAGAVACAGLRTAPAPPTLGHFLPLNSDRRIFVIRKPPDIALFRATGERAADFERKSRIDGR